jgi:hypothetical protein
MPELFGDDHRNAETGDGAHVDLADVHGHRAVFIHFTIEPPPGPALSIHEPVARPMPWFFSSFTLPSRFSPWRF